MRFRAPLARQVLPALLGAIVSCASLAQVPPGTGRDIGVPETPPEERRPSGLEIKPLAPPTPQLEGVGTLTVSRFRISGLTAFDPAELDSVLAPWIGRELSAADLAQAAGALTGRLRERGLYVAYAFLPDQRIVDGVVEIAVVEGRLGSVKLEMPEDSRLKRSVAEGVLAPLRPGTRIARGEFDTPLLILNDLPGVRVTPALTRGSEPGAADLIVRVEDEPVAGGFLRLDNHQVRELGEYELTGHLRLRNPLGIGDLATAELTRSHTGGRTLGSASYSLPVNYSGTRVGVAVRNQHTRVGGDFELLRIRGKWTRGTLAVTHPFLRTHDRNIQGSLSLSEIGYHDRIEAFGLVNDSRHRYATATVVGDWVDRLLGEGRNRVQVEHQTGRVYLDTPAAAAADAAALQVNGRFDRSRVRFERVQTLDARSSLLLSLGTQFASKNLDAGRELQISGPEGVRAYSTEELVADEGYVATIEYRRVISIEGAWRWGAIAFFDTGRGKIDKNPVPGSAGNARKISGYGLGLAVSVRDVFNAEVTLAWRADDVPVTDPDRRPRVWFVVRRLF